VAQFLFGEGDMSDEAASVLTLFQKSLKYGLPDWQSISCYEYGFADRLVAQCLCDAVQTDGFSGIFFSSALRFHRRSIEAALTTQAISSLFLKVEFDCRTDNFGGSAFNTLK
jgi:hypothetical protein